MRLRRIYFGKTVADPRGETRFLCMKNDSLFQTAWILTTCLFFWILVQMHSMV